MTTPYVYFIMWTELDKSYFGKRTAVGCHPDELFNDSHPHPYRTSSGFIENRRRDDGETVHQYWEIYGNPDLMIIVEVESPAIANELEVNFLNLYNAQNDSRFLNQSNGNLKFDNTGRKRSKSAIAKLIATQTGVKKPKHSASLKRKWSDPKYKQKMSEINSKHRNNPESMAKWKASCKQYWENSPQQDLPDSVVVNAYKRAGGSCQRASQLLGKYNGYVWQRKSRKPHLFENVVVDSVPSYYITAEQVLTALKNSGGNERQASLALDKNPYFISNWKRKHPECFA